MRTIVEKMYQAADPHRRMVRDMPLTEQPLYRLQVVGVRRLATAEVLAAVLQTSDALDLAQDLLNQFGGVDGLIRASVPELSSVAGVGVALAGRIKAALELGRRGMTTVREVRTQITSPAGAANLLMSDMMHLEQEEVRVILLDTRTRVLAIPTIYIGSLNTAVVRIADIFRAAIKYNAAAMILAHNHPSGECSPSPEDVRLTQEVAKIGKVMSIDVLDHIIIGHQRFVSLKERGLGFD